MEGASNVVGQVDSIRKILKLRDFPFAVLITLTLICVLTAFVATRVNSHLLGLARQEALQDANQDADAIAGALQRELIKIDVIARAIRFSLERHPNLTQAEYSDLVAPLIATSPSILLVGRSDRYILDQIHPLAGNESALGLDYRNVPGQFDSVEEVLRTGQSTLNGPVELVQGGTAFIQRTPYFAESGPDISKAASGIISVVIDRDSLLSQITESHGIGANKVALRKLDRNLAPVGSLYGPQEIFSEAPVLRPLPSDGGWWQIGLIPETGWPRDVHAAGLVWVFSSVASGLFGFLLLALWSMYRSKRTAENQLRSAINSIEDGFALYDQDDRLVFANEKYLSYYSLSRDAIFPGNSFENILRAGLENGQYKDGIGREEDWLKERLEAHGNPTEPVEQKLADGRWLKIAETRSPEGNTVGFRVDVTELKQAREKAEAANQAKNNFLNIISHELRTPLTSVIGYARFLENLEVLPGYKKLDQSLATAATSAERKTALAAMRAEVSAMSNRITVASDHLLGLINDVLDRAKLEADTIELRTEPLALEDLVTSVTTGLVIKAAENGIELKTDVAPMTVTADAKRLRQALINVVGNAIKFTEKGGVYVSSEHDETCARIIVRDTGCGIPAAEQEQIFDQFVQVDTSVTRRNSGAGLGLAITRELIELHGGTVTVSSELGHGSTFTISIPAKAGEVEIAA